MERSVVEQGYDAVVAVIRDGRRVSSRRNLVGKLVWTAARQERSELLDVELRKVGRRRRLSGYVEHERDLAVLRRSP